MSADIQKIRTIYNAKFPDLVGLSDARFLSQPIGNWLIKEDFCGPVLAREAIDETAEAHGIELAVEDIARFTTIQDLVDLVDDRTA